jgi:hypothetical protein
MAEIRNYTMNFGFGRRAAKAARLNLASQVSLHRNKPLKRLVVGRDYDLLRPEVHG